MRDGKNSPEKIVSDPTQDKTLKPKKEKPEAKINKYGFLHVDKGLAKHLGVEFGKDKADVPVTIERIDGGFVVKVVKV